MNNQFLKYVYPIAATLVAAGIALFFLTRPAPPKSMDSVLFNPETEKLSAIREGLVTFGFADPDKLRKDSLLAALDLYQGGKYEASEPALREYLQAHPGDLDAQFYLGMSQLYLEQREPALDILSKLARIDTFHLQDDALWYSALSSTNIDREHSVRTLEGLSKNPASKYQQAAEAVLATVELNPGNFSFQIQSNGRAGGSEEIKCSLILEVRPAWWQTWWTRALVALLFPGGAVSLLVWRKQMRIKEQKAFEQKVAQRTEGILQEKKEIQQAKDALEKEKERSEELLLNILPAEIAEELKSQGFSNARRFEQATVLFCDFLGFTEISEQLSPEALVTSLNSCFEAFDHIVTAHRLEKIKTVGDCYICAGGLTAKDDDNVFRVIQAAQDMVQYLQGFNARQSAEGKPVFEARIGINTGVVVAGIVGIKKYAYDIWGDAVNIAARMEQSSEPGRINISGFTYELVKEHFPCEYRGKIEAKGKGAVDMYFVA